MFEEAAALDAELQQLQPRVETLQSILDALPVDDHGHAVSGPPATESNSPVRERRHSRSVRMSEDVPKSDGEDSVGSAEQEAHSAHTFSGDEAVGIPVGCTAF